MIAMPYQGPSAFSADAALLLVRVVVGLLFVGHGLQKLTGWFGGHGLAGTAGFFGALGLRPAALWAAVAGLAELLGGAGLALGLLAPVAAALIAGVMLFAIALVHAAKGLWVSAGGFEYNLVMLAAAAAVGLHGAGRYALDALLAERYGFQLPAGPFPIFVVLVLVALIALAIELAARRTGQSAPRGSSAAASA